jgi:glycosyltransferase involved in cell wall biosynthesis
MRMGTIERQLGTRVTVVIPVWDAPYVEYLPRSAASVRRQGPGVPLLIIDNASTEPIADQAGATVLRTDKRLSTGAARNLGLRHVETEYVVFLDADDELLDGALVELTRGIESDPAVVAYVMSMLEGATGARHRVPRRSTRGLAALPNHMFALATAVWSAYPTQGSTIMRTNAVRASGGYGDCSRGEDWLLAVALAFRGSVRCDPRPAQIYHGDAPPGPGRVFGMDEVASIHRHIRRRIRADAAAPCRVGLVLPGIRALQWLMRALVPLYRSALRKRRAARQAAIAPGSRTTRDAGRQT